MIKNYYYLNRSVCELQFLIGSQFEIPFTQEKNKLAFQFNNEKMDSAFLLLSIDQNLPFIIIKDAYSRAKKNSIDFFPNFFPSTLKMLEIAYRERIIKFTFEGFYLFYTLRGKDSNICVVDSNNNLFTFKSIKIDKEELINNFNKQKYSSMFNLPLQEIESITLDLNIKKIFPEFGSRIINEIKLRSSDSNIKEVFTQILYEIHSEEIAIWQNKRSNEIYLQPATFTGFQDYQNNKFLNFQDAINFYLRNKYSASSFNDSYNQISNHISRELKSLSKKLNNLKERIEKGDRSKEYQKYGDLILMNLNEITNAKSKIKLIDPKDGKDYSINIDRKLTPQQNAAKYYEKAKDEKINYVISKQLFDKSQKRFIELKEKSKILECSKSIDELIKIKNELKLDKKTKESKMDSNINYRHYIIYGKFHVYVGKDSKSNDLLTTKFAKQNDYWFHARGYSGSHVILRVDNPKEGVPKTVIKDAASIAAFYSKGKTAKTTPVSYTFRKYVRKNKGMAPGKVLLMKEDVLLVTPQIPENCEINDE